VPLVPSGRRREVNAEPTREPGQHVEWLLCGADPTGRNRPGAVVLASYQLQSSFNNAAHSIAVQVVAAVGRHLVPTRHIHCTIIDDLVDR
jgi:hypothetical protein